MGDTAAGAGVPDAPDVPDTPRGQRGGTVLTGAAYAMLAVVGVGLGVTGAFQHAAYFGTGLPLAAIGWLVLLFGAVYGMGRLMGGKLGALVPAVVWMLVSMVFAGQRSEGDLVIAANTAGYLYLYGGFAAVLLAVLLVPSHGPSWLLWGAGSSPAGDAQSRT